MNKQLLIFYFTLICFIFTITHCGNHYTSPYDEKVNKITDEEIQTYLGMICLTLGGHIGLEAIGTCGQCGGMTPCCNMAICDACAAERGVCPFCLKKVNWTKNTDPEKEIPILLAILKRVDDISARQVAIHALTQIKEPGTLKLMMQYSDEKMLSLELASAVGVFKDERYIGFLKKVLRQADDDYFGDGNDYETQYYISNAAQAAAASLAKINTRKAADILLASAKRGKLWERCFAIRVMGDVHDNRVKQVLTSCLKEFFTKNSDWKWIPGRELIGATLQSLAKIGDKETALLVIYYIRNPGCDFLYEELKACLSSIGKPAVPELITAIKEDLNANLYDWGRQILIEALGNIGDPSASSFFIEMLDWQYPDQWSERDIKGLALAGLGNLKAHNALDKIEHELFNGKDESIRQIAATALGQISGEQAFKILEKKLKQSDSKWVTRECLASLNSIAFKEINTDEIKLTASIITAKKAGFEDAFQMMYQPVLDGEAWSIDYFFEILHDVSMKRNYYNIVELLNTNNKKVYDKTITFLKKFTNLKIKAQFSDSPEQKQQIKQALYNWYQQHHQEL